MLSISSCGGETFSKPPELTVTCGDESITVNSGNYSWTAKKGSGSAIACGIHPLESRLGLTPFEVSDGTVTLSFEAEPDSISARCWGDVNMDNTSAESEDTALSGNNLTLKSGGYIYEVTAKWESEKSYGGTASYAFYIVLQ